jgi:hypothetical protein
VTGVESEKSIDELLAEEADASEAGRDLPGEYVRHRRPAKDPSQVYSLRVPVRRLEELRQLAEAQGVEPSTLMRQWVIERLDQEKAQAASPTSLDAVRDKLTRARKLLDEVRQAEERLLPGAAAH